MDSSNCIFPANEHSLAKVSQKNLPAMEPVWESNGRIKRDRLHTIIAHIKIHSCPRKLSFAIKTYWKTEKFVT